MNTYRVEVIVNGSHEEFIVDATSYLKAMDAADAIIALTFDTEVDYDVYEVEAL